MNPLPLPDLAAGASQAGFIKRPRPFGLGLALAPVPAAPHRSQPSLRLRSSSAATARMITPPMMACCK